MTGMTSEILHAGSRGLALGLCAAAMSGCMGPTYGTGVSQGQQLFNDIDNIATLGTGSNTARVDYSPRPELVRPTDKTVLPPPRQTAEQTDPNWPESPEQRRGRLRAAAPDGRENPLPASFMTAEKEGMEVETPSRGSTVGRRVEMENSWLSPKQMAGQRVAAAERSKIGRQGDPNQRRYLSEPPLTYRAPAATAPAGDPGVDEEVKERRAKGTTTVASKLKNLWPF